jgi:predicted dehydrogenase
VKFLIAGLGSIGRRHLRNLLTLGEQDILLYRTGRSTLPDDELAEFPVETDLAAALAHQPDGVIVANPTSLHLDVAIPVAETGCHILIEKPISHSMTGIAKLQSAVQQGGGQVLIGYQFRFHPGLQQLSRLLTEAAIGRPLSIRAHWGEYLPGWHPWEDYRQSYSARAELGGGVVLTLSHPLDYLRWLLGEVDSLWALAGRLSDLSLGVEDTAEIGLSFKNGMLGSLHLDYNQRPPAHHLEIVGSLGTLRWDNADGAVSVYTNGQANWDNLPAPPDFERNDLFLAEMQHFLAVCRGEAEPVCGLADGIRSLKLALAVLYSAEHRLLVEPEILCE